MGVLDGKNILKQHKTIITGVFLITFFLRFLCFYNVPGITTRNGWAAPIHSKEIFFIAVITFFDSNMGN